MSDLNLSEILFAGAEHRPFVVTPREGKMRGSALLLHGFPGTPAEMRPLARWLAGAGWLAYGPLLPGFGPEIAALGSIGREQWVTAARAAGRTLRKRSHRLLVVGYSLGAAVALSAAAAIRPDALILLAPFWQANSPSAYLVPALKYVWPEIAPFSGADFQDPDVRRLLEQMAPTLDLDDSEVQAALKEQLVLPTAAIDELLKVGREGYRFAARLKIPTLILQGRADDVVTPAATRALVNQMGGSVSYHEIPGDHQFPTRTGNGTARAFERLIGAFIEGNLSG